MTKPKRIGKFLLKDEISRGGMGIVYNGLDEDLKRPLAIKMLPHEIFANKEQKDRFILEAQIVAKLDHPNIMKVYAIEFAEDTVWIVMELLSGTLLSDLIKNRGQVPPPEAANILEQLSKALHYAHSKGIIHRDIKPGNVMISPEGIVKLMDFGIARDEEADLNLTQAGTIMGTPKYMSPEQFSGEKTDQRSDIYSLGVMAYEMLAGSPPFLGKNLAQIAYKHMHEKAVPLKKKVKNLTPELDRFITASLEKKVEERLNTLKDVDLGGGGSKINVITRKKIFKYKALAFLLLILTVSGVVFFFFYSRKTKEKKYQKSRELKAEAVQLIEKDEWFKAKGVLTEASIITPDDTEIQKYLEKVIANTEKIQAEKQGDKLFQDAVLALERGDEKLFSECIKKAVDIAPTKKEYYLEQQMLKLKISRRSKGSQLFSKALEALSAGERDKFEKFVEEAGVADPGNKGDYTLRATEELKLFNKAKAKDLYNKALKYLDDDDEISFNKFIQMAQDISPDEDYINKAAVELKSYKNIKANKFYEKAIILSGENRIVEADEYLEKCVILNPNHADAFNLLAENCLYKEELNYSKYTDSLEKSLAINAKHESRWRNLILGYSEAGFLEKAKDALKRALKIFPDSSALKNLEGSLG